MSSMEGGDRDKKLVSPKNSSNVDDEADVFEITDFTTASVWECFIARLEEILHEWKLVNHEPCEPALKDQYASGTWAERTEEVVFVDFRFHFSYLYLKGNDEVAPKSTNSKREDVEESDDDHKTPTVFFDLMNLENDFPMRAHYLCRWYGLQEFFTLMPVSEKQYIDSESRAKLLLSSSSIALANCNCSIPVFIQLHQKWRKLFTGTCLVPGASIEFEMSHLRKFPPQFCHLAGLLDVFKSKLGCVYISMPPVSVSVRFTYILKDWFHSAWPQMPPDFSSISDGEVGYGDLDFLPFGACTDPISELHLSCTWPCLSEDMIVENSLYSDLDPLQAPQWNVKLQMTDDPQCLLGEFLKDFLKLCDRIESTDEVLKKVLVDTDGDKHSAEITHALQKLTEPVPALSSLPSLGNVVSSASSRIKFKPNEAPIPDILMDRILQYLFPDAKIPRSQSGLKSPSSKSARKESNVSLTSGSLTSSVSEHTIDEDKKAETEKISDILTDLSKQLKSAPVDSLTHRLSLALCNVNHNFGGLLGVAHLWQEFILEMRFRWENKHLICSIEKGTPNMGSCLLHQKLQMLNCCIECKIKRESAGYGYGPDSQNIHNQLPDVIDASSPKAMKRLSKAASSLGYSDDDDEEEEFFECDDDEAGPETKVDDATNVKDDDSVKGRAKNGPDEAENALSSDSSSLSCKSDVNDKRKELKNSSRNSSMSSSIFHDSLSHRPEGRMVPMKNVYLLNSGEQLYIPITQEPSPMTEDMLEEQAEVLAKLGTSAEGSQIRARMQSACLVSDMESFKAANPGCILEDFVRWYSPRDYVVEGETNLDNENDLDGESLEADQKGPNVFKRGHLSQRMQIPGNMWVEAWQSARAVPARRQKRLFDDTKEAEKVLHYLASMKPAEVVLHLMPCVVHAAVAKLVEEAAQASVPNLKNIVEPLIARVAKVTRNFPFDKKKYSELLRLIEIAEVFTARTVSLRSKFTSDHLTFPEQEGKETEIENFVTALLNQGEVLVKGGACGPAGAIIHKMFIASQRANNMILDDEDNEEDSISGKPNQDSKKSSMQTLQASSEIRSSSSCSDFPAASTREYILRAMVPRPAPYSKVLPQRMYCILADGESRLAGAFISDTTFQ
ncbi:rab3 GTPase-activating protein catalytic subunit [Biomphalaria pfeifferi]|uniref:Rab3 GTPase-activating protein catalytic subunit n=1 Tax=Biomphalaria pfeifferi TaxID=112525 RepID=A0AAD8B7U1_BIOPF|nr:rab3 GTPase-activating protein catalytic subunit [Biomphalaria pfeifferi]